MVDDLKPDEREHLRDSWESLEPDDALEGLVLDAARDVPQPRRTIPLWLPAVSLAAAVLLLAVFSRREPDPVPTTAQVPIGDDDGEDGLDADDVEDHNETPNEEPVLDDVTNEPTIWSPPSVAQAETARARNMSDIGSLESLPAKGRVAYQAAGKWGTIEGSTTETMPAQSEKGLHRFVVREVWEPGKKKVYPPASVIPDMQPLAARVGRQFIDAARKDAAEPIQLHGTVVVEIRTPERNAATTRLRVRVDPGFPGWAIVPNDVARALGLTQFEIPGGAEVIDESTTRRGYRVRAVLALPGTRVKRDVEVFVPRAWRPQLFAMMGDEHDEPKQDVRLYGPIPPYISKTQGISYRAEDGAHYHGATGLMKPTEAERREPFVSVAIPFEAPVSLFLDYDDGRQLWLPAIDLGGDWGSTAIENLGEYSWQADEAACPAGSKFIASTVWRGTRASVGPSGCAFGVVKAGGRFEAVFVKDVDLHGLRALVTRPDGTTIWVDAGVDDVGGAAAMLQGTATRPMLLASGSTLAVSGQGGVRFHSLVAPDGTRKPYEEVLAKVLAAWRTRLDAVKPTAVAVVIDDKTPWVVVARALDVARAAGVRTLAMQRLDAEGVASRVESIRVPTPQANEIERRIDVTISKSSATQSHVDWKSNVGTDGQITFSDRSPFLSDAVVHDWRTITRQDPKLVVDVTVKDEMRVPAMVLLDVFRLFREAQITHYRFRK